MSNRFKVAAPALAAALLVGSCESPTRPAPAAGSAGSGDDTECIGALTGVHDNVIVPSSGFCVISGATIRGNVKALPGSLVSINTTTIHGSVEGEGVLQVWLQGGNTVGGNIQIKEGFNGLVCGTTLPNGNIQIEKMTQLAIVGTSPGRECTGNVIMKGNVKVQENFTDVLDGVAVRDNVIGQNLQVFNNHGPGSKAVQGNIVGQTLQCFDNTPPFVGGPNVAEQAEGQCF